MKQDYYKGLRKGNPLCLNIRTSEQEQVVTMSFFNVKRHPSRYFNTE